MMSDRCQKDAHLIWAQKTQELHRLIEEKGTHTDPEVLKKSQELDECIIQHLQEQQKEKAPGEKPRGLLQRT